MSSFKSEHWQKVENKVEKITDALGLEIDTGIKKIVIALMVYKFPTCASCEGHLDRSVSYPWVAVRHPEPKGWRRNTKKRRLWERANLRHQQRMVELLKSFYHKRKVPYDQMLVVYSFGCDIRLVNIGGSSTLLLPLSQKERKLHAYRREMNAFAAFLKKRFVKARS